MLCNRNAFLHSEASLHESVRILEVYKGSPLADPRPTATGSAKKQRTFGSGGWAYAGNCCVAEKTSLANHVYLDEAG